KIGMSINPELGDEIKVTVVATGMGLSRAAKATPKATGGHINQNAITGEANYEGLDKPTVLRQNRTESRETRFGAQPKKDVDLDYLDIPAFLRRQAD
ncbi:MAG: cell division protein FtsZ, partial [Methylococcaceae bacterium]|nr:cell division protein FtsZ [Methylococcaceae bacterium]